MIFLTDTTETLNVVTTTAGKVDFTVYYADHTTSTFTPSANQGTISAIADTTAVSAPVAGAQRQVKTMIITNRDISPTAQTVFVKKHVAGVDTYLTVNTALGLGESLEYMDRRGWKVLNRQGAVKYKAAVVGTISSVSLGPMAIGMGDSARLHVTGAFWSTCVGKSPRYPVNSLRVRWRVSTAGVGYSWAELGVYVGSSPHGANATATMAMVQSRCVAYANVTTEVATISRYDTTLTSPTGMVIPPGEDVWIAFNGEFVTTGCTLVASRQDDLVSGSVVFVTAAQRRPSVELGQAVSLPGLGVLAVAPFFQVYW